MKRYKFGLVLVSIFIEILAIVFFLLGQIEPLPFFLIVMSQAFLLALYIMDRNKQAQQ